MTSESWHVLTVLPHLSAVLLRGALEAEGVRVQLGRDALGVVYRLDTGGHATRVLVPRDDMARAGAVLADIEADLEVGG